MPTSDSEVDRLVRLMKKHRKRFNAGAGEFIVRDMLRIEPNALQRRAAVGLRGILFFSDDWEDEAARSRSVDRARASFGEDTSTVMGTRANFECLVLAAHDFGVSTERVAEHFAASRVTSEVCDLFGLGAKFTGPGLALSVFPRANGQSGLFEAVGIDAW